MALFTWNAQYALGNPQIDAEHKQLFALAEQLHHVMSTGAPAESVGKVLASLIDYTKTHFSHEEQLMVRHQYPEYKAHKALHDELTDKVLALQRDFAAKKVCLSIDIMRFLKDWLSHHIGNSDRKIAEFLKAHAA